MLATTILTLALAADPVATAPPATHLVILYSGHKLEARSVRIDGPMALVVDAQGNTLSLRASTIDQATTDLANAQRDKARLAEAEATENARILAEIARQQREDADAITSRRSGRAGGVSVAGSSTVKNPKAVSKASMALPPGASSTTATTTTSGGSTATRVPTSPGSSSVWVIRLKDIRSRHAATKARITQLTAKQDALASAGDARQAERDQVREQLDAAWASEQAIEIEFREAQAGARQAGTPATVWSPPLQ